MYRQTHNCFFTLGKNTSAPTVVTTEAATTEVTTAEPTTSGGMARFHASTVAKYHTSTIWLHIPDADDTQAHLTTIFEEVHNSRHLNLPKK